jgi:diguanylate cyclase (GGDEF)-like protein
MLPKPWSAIWCELKEARVFINPTGDPGMYDKDEMLRNLSDNEEIAKRLFEIEVSILSIGNLKDLLEKLLLSIEEKFGIPHLWISLVHENEVSQLIEALESSEVLKQRYNLVDRSLFLDLLHGKEGPVLVNENLGPFYRLLPENQTYFLKSLAIAPLVLDGEVIGSLNLGDYSGFRFQPNMDTFFLSQLAIKISICLSNVTAREKLRYLATRDPLTSLFNRREMGKTLEREISRTQRYGIPLAVLLVDCDDLKTVNDTYGHNCGDALLRYVADQIMRMTRRDDMAFRCEGDGFVIMLPHQTSNGALRVSERLGAFFRENPMKFGETSIPVSISCGLASTADPEVNSAGELLNRANGQLYEAKK